MRKLQVIQTRPDLADTTVFAPGLRVAAGTSIVFLSGISAAPLYPDPSFTMPDDGRDQHRLAMENIQEVLDQLGFTWRNVVKIVKYYVEWGGSDIMDDYLGDWKPCSTLLKVSAVPIAGARFVFDVTLAGGTER